LLQVVFVGLAGSVEQFLHVLVRWRFEDTHEAILAHMYAI
jgi:hypothetical protein